MKNNPITPKPKRKKLRWKLMDIHTHILPGVDDGAVNLQETMRMLELADREEISVLIATPHYGRRNPNYDPDQARRTFDAVKTCMQEQYPHMKIYMGNELYYSPGILEDLKIGRAKTIGGTDYALIEFSVDVEYDYIVEAVRDCIREGYRPILAHVERYACLYKQFERIGELMEQGAYMQVNAGGFLPGGKPDKRKVWCRTLLEEGMIHFIASDCHNTDSRKPIMYSAAEEMIKLAGIDTARRIINTNIIKLIRNEYI